MDIYHGINEITIKDYKAIKKHIAKKGRDIIVKFKLAKGYANYGDIKLISNSSNLQEKLIDTRIIKKVLKAYARLRIIKFNMEGGD